MKKVSSPLKGLVCVLMFGALGACVTNTTPEQRAQLKQIENERRSAEYTVGEYNRCSAKVTGKYSSTALGRKFGIQDTDKQPYSASQLSNRSKITDEESRAFMAYNLDQHTCVEKLVGKLTRHAPFMGEMLRGHYNKGTANLGDLLNRDITIGQFLSRGQKIEATITADFNAGWTQVMNSNPQLVPVPSSRPKAIIQRPITVQRVEPSDMNFVSYTIPPVAPESGRIRFNRRDCHPCESRDPGDLT